MAEFGKAHAAEMISQVIEFVIGLGFSVQMLRDEDTLVMELVVYDAPDSSFGAVAFEEGP